MAVPWTLVNGYELLNQPHGLRHSAHGHYRVTRQRANKIRDMPLMSLCVRRTSRRQALWLAPAKNPHQIHTTREPPPQLYMPALCYPQRSSGALQQETSTA